MQCILVRLLAISVCKRQGQRRGIHGSLQESHVIESEGRGDEKRVYVLWCQKKESSRMFLEKDFPSSSVWNGWETLEHTTKDAEPLCRSWKECSRAKVVNEQIAGLSSWRWPLQVTRGLKGQRCPCLCPYLKANSNLFHGLKRLLYPWQAWPVPRGSQPRGSATRKTRERCFNIIGGFVGERVSSP